MAFKLGVTGRLMQVYNYAHARVDDLDLDARSQWLGGSVRKQISAS